MKCKNIYGKFFEYDVETIEQTEVFPSEYFNKSASYIITRDGYFVPVGNKGFHYLDISKYLGYYFDDTMNNKTWAELIHLLNKEGMVYTVPSLNNDGEGNRLFSFPSLEDMENMTDECKVATKLYIEKCKIYEYEKFKLIYANLETSTYFDNYDEVMKHLKNMQKEK